MKKRLVVKSAGSGPIKSHGSPSFMVPDNSWFLIIHAYPIVLICYGLRFLITPGLIPVYLGKRVSQVFRLPRISYYPFPVTLSPGFGYSGRINLCSSTYFKRSAGSLRAVCRQIRQAAFFINLGQSARRLPVGC